MKLSNKQRKEAGKAIYYAICRSVDLDLMPRWRDLGIQQRWAMYQAADAAHERIRETA
jgi:hypothetical protein